MAYQKPSQFLVSIGGDEKRWVTRAHLRLLLPPWWEEWNLSSTDSSPFRTVVMLPSRSLAVTPSSSLLNVHDHEESDDDLRKEDISFCVADSGPLTPGRSVGMLLFNVNKKVFIGFNMYINLINKLLTT
jgi:hypothetical protein